MLTGTMKMAILSIQFTYRGLVISKQQILLILLQAYCTRHIQGRMGWPIMSGVINVMA